MYTQSGRKLFISSQIRHQMSNLNVRWIVLNVRWIVLWGCFKCSHNHIYTASFHQPNELRNIAHIRLTYACQICILCSTWYFNMKIIMHCTAKTYTFEQLNLEPNLKKHRKCLRLKRFFIWKSIDNIRIEYFPNGTEPKVQGLAPFTFRIMD